MCLEYRKKEDGCSMKEITLNIIPEHLKLSRKIRPLVRREIKIRGW